MRAKIYRDPLRGTSIQLSEPAIQIIGLSKIPRFLRALCEFMHMIGSDKAFVCKRWKDLEIRFLGVNLDRAIWRPTRKGPDFDELTTTH